VSVLPYLDPVEKALNRVRWKLEHPEEHKAKKRRDMNRRHARLAGLGMCTACGKPNGSQSKWRCLACQKRGLELVRARIAVGICLGCKQPALPTVQHCLRHWFARTGGTHGLNAKNGGVQMLKEIWAEQGGRCALTGAILEPGVDASLDHKIPRSRGGDSSRGNLQWVTTSVNWAKSNLSSEDFVEMCRLVILRHPELTK
jgi:hypothetical protein